MSGVVQFNSTPQSTIHNPQSAYCNAWRLNGTAQCATPWKPTALQVTQRLLVERTCVNPTSHQQLSMSFTKSQVWIEACRGLVNVGQPPCAAFSFK